MLMHHRLHKLQDINTFGLPGCEGKKPLHQLFMGPISMVCLNTYPLGHLDQTPFMNCLITFTAAGLMG